MSGPDVADERLRGLDAYIDRQRHVGSGLLARPGGAERRVLEASGLHKSHEYHAQESLEIDGANAARSRNVLKN